ncbi:MAG: nitrous oxide reductase family maturation protein NosD [Bacteroidota bacterium]|nr:nitrous oxide reductase family maturation protein NosD [Bacteroidota bacterium]
MVVKKSTYVLFAVIFVQSLIAQQTIQTLIEQAQPGDTVIVDGGRYCEDIVIAKSIHLIGKQSPVIYGTGKGSIVTILAPWCTVSGFVIEHSGNMLVNEDAGILLKSDHNTIRDNRLSDILFGIYLMQSDSNIIAFNKVTGRSTLDQGERGSGIHLWNSNYNMLEHNTISETRDGFYIQNANHTLIQDNEVYHLRYGLHYMYADSNTFLRNTFRDNIAGAAIMFTRGIVMKHNVFLRNRGFSSYGMLLQDCHYSIADSNIFSDNVTGIFFESSTNNLFRNNIVARNDLALMMFQNAIHNTFTENNFIDNLNPLTIVGRRTESLWSLNGRGNYWSSYDGYDIDNNGIGDVPMKVENVFSYLEGKNANVRLYLYSPASQALAVSAKAFPILDISGERDEYPLMEPVPLKWFTTIMSDDGKRATKPTTASFIPWLMPIVISIVIVFVLRIRKKKLL